MGIKWFRRSDDGRAAALDALAAAAADADRGGSLYDTANALVRLVLDRVEPDNALRVLSALRPRTCDWRPSCGDGTSSSARTSGGRKSASPHESGRIRWPCYSRPALATGASGSVP
jgi:hypothetical protein